MDFVALNPSFSFTTRCDCLRINIKISHTKLLAQAVFCFKAVFPAASTQSPDLQVEAVCWLVLKPYHLSNTETAGKVGDYVSSSRVVRSWHRSLKSLKGTRTHTNIPSHTRVHGPVAQACTYKNKHTVIEKCKAFHNLDLAITKHIHIMHLWTHKHTHTQENIWWTNI